MPTCTLLMHNHNICIVSKPLPLSPRSTTPQRCAICSCHADSQMHAGS